MKHSHQFSRIIAGAMTWGSWGKQFSGREMTDRMHQCLELGISTFDHADIYGGYTTEADFGRAFKESGLVRDRMQLISKCGIQYVCDGRENKIKHYNYRSDYIIWSAEESLRNLRTDYLDLFLLHRPSPLMNPAEIARAIEQLKKDGKIRHFGVSNFSPSQVALIASLLVVEANQVEVSLTSDTAMYDGTLDDCMIHGRIAMAWSPLGNYFKGEGEQHIRIREVLGRFCEQYNATEMQLLLAWLLRHPARIFPVVGTTDTNRLRESADALQIDLELEDWFALTTAAKGHKVP